MSTTDEPVMDETEQTEEQESVEEPAGEGSEGAEDPNAGAKKALVAERAARKAAERELAALRASQELASKPAEEQALEAARAEGRSEAKAAGDARIVRAELRAAAAGRVKSPERVLKLIDMSVIDVDDDGNVDADALEDAISGVLAEFPELAAGRFGGGADQGAKGKDAKPSQLTAQELKNLSPAEVLKADREGRLDALKGLNK